MASDTRIHFLIGLALLSGCTALRSETLPTEATARSPAQRTSEDSGMLSEEAQRALRALHASERSFAAEMNLYELHPSQIGFRDDHEDLVVGFSSACAVRHGQPAVGVNSTDGRDLTPELERLVGVLERVGAESANCRDPLEGFVAIAVHATSAGYRAWLIDEEGRLSSRELSAQGAR